MSNKNLKAVRARMKGDKALFRKSGRMHILGLPVEDVGESITGRPRLRISAILDPFLK